MEKITKDLLESVAPGTIIASGSFKDCGATNICDTDNVRSWVAVRGGIPDWTIYYQPIYLDELLFPTDWDNDLIKRVWDKFPKSMAEELVSLDSYALGMYRT